MNRATKVGVVVAAVVLASACGGNANAEALKPPGWHEISTPYDVDTIYTWCDHGNRIYQTYRAIAVATADPSCAAVAK